ncbi:thioesterase II family protein [Solidesulfovibrio sp. C21]|uniref:thioesterase II family protein n=1 Tax=Solidesulfovibrio sp. C21 TaxID=3398613 RepID=UPI0039FC5123
MKRQYKDMPWLMGAEGGDDPLLRLFCFPYGGSGASIYRHWQEDVSDGIEVCPVQLPGRENRINDPLATDMEGLLDSLLACVEDGSDIPFAFFGHSMGGIIAFELARHLGERHLVEPVHLFISGTPIPRMFEEHARTGRCYHRLPDDQFLKLVLGTSKGIPDQVLLSEEMMRLILPILRADLALMESLPLASGRAPLPIPMTVFGGAHDELVAPTAVAAWENYTTASFTKIMFPGGHYFLHTDHDMLLRHINETALLYLI